MPKKALRPRIRISSPEKKNVLLERLKERLRNPESKILGIIAAGVITLKIPPEERHYWSPELTFTFEDEENGTLIRGFFGPPPAVWTMFISFYALSLFALLMGLLFGMTQWSLGMAPVGLWVALVAALLFAGAYAIAWTGQKLSYEHMHLQRNFLYDSLNLPNNQPE